MLYEKIKFLCESKGIPITRLEAEVGLKNGAIGKWKDSVPSALNLKAVADYLGVSVDWLLHGIEKKV